MTREEFLNKKVENLVNNYILPTLSEREKPNEGLIAKANLWGFLYSVGRMDPLRYVMNLSHELTDAELEKINNKLMEEDR